MLRILTRNKRGIFHEIIPLYFKTMFIFNYNKRIDKECWRRIVKAGSMFGNEFPKSFDISKKDINKAQEMVLELKKIWHGKSSDFNKGIKKIYGYHFPKNIKCFVNTSPCSMDNFKSGYISISITRDTPEKMIGTIIHEACHFVFRKYFTDFCYEKNCTNDDIENIKEILTIINNDVFNNINDCGYKIHKSLRSRALRYWRGGKNLKWIITETKKSIDKRKSKTKIFH